MSGYREIAIFLLSTCGAVTSARTAATKPPAVVRCRLPDGYSTPLFFVEGDKMKWLRSSQTSEPHACRLGPGQS
nr:MAG TPA: hypothetical protein [Caudoviricetes sp.]